MGRKSTIAKIDGRDFHCTQHEPLESVQLMVTFTKMITPFAAMIDRNAGSLEDLVNNVEIGEAAMPLMLAFGQLEDGRAAAIIADVLKYSRAADGSGSMVELNSPERINEAFAGELLLLYKCVWEALKLNFANFLKPALAVVASVTGKATDESSP